MYIFSVFNKYFFLIGLFVITPNILFSQTNSNTLFELKASKQVMGTIVEVTALHTDIDSCKKAMFYALKEFERIDNTMSVFKENSEIYLINKFSGIKHVKVSYETFSIIERSINYSKEFEGLFDITIGPISELWGFSTNSPVTVLPKKEKIDSLLSFVNYNLIQLNYNDTSVYLPHVQMRLDLGGIAKGYAIDKASIILKNFGIKNFLINAGGDIYASGHNGNNQNWTIGIKHPRKVEEIFAKLDVSDIAVATSGDYERFAIIDNVRYHHIFNPFTGYPVNSSQSATAIDSSTERAVILSKYLFIIGYEKYEKLKNKLGTKGIIVKTGGNINYDQDLAKGNNLLIVDN